jgi:hypothetical protein
MLHPNTEIMACAPVLAVRLPVALLLELDYSLLILVGYAPAPMGVESHFQSPSPLFLHLPHLSGCVQPWHFDGFI